MDLVHTQCTLVPENGETGLLGAGMSLFEERPKILTNVRIYMRKCLDPAYAPLAQLDRASDYGSEGREFESLRAHG